MSSYDLTETERLHEEALMLHKTKTLRSLIHEDATVPISDEQVQKLFTLAMEIYVLKLNHNPGLLPFGGNGSVTPTDVSKVVTKMLREADLQLFELAMWQGMRGE